MRNSYSVEQLHLASRLYYVDGLGQAEVAKLVNVSQAKVSRLLALARERGVVRISVAEYDARDRALEQELCKHTGLSMVAAIKAVEGGAAADARLSVGHFGAEFVSSVITKESSIAIAGGRTMRDLIQRLPENKRLDVSVLQAMGSIDSTPGPVDAVELGRTIADRFGGTFSTLNTPAFVPDEKVRNAFAGLPQVKSVLERLGRVDVALVGIGTLENSIFVERGVLTERDAVKLKACGAVGEICGRFFNENGRECDSRWRDRVVSMSVEQLRKAPLVVGVVVGSDRIAALSAAIRGGLLKALVIDAPSAAALLASFKSSATAVAA